MDDFRLMWRTLSYNIQNRTWKLLLRMRTSDGKIQIRHPSQYQMRWTEQNRTNSSCTCALWTGNRHCPLRMRTTRKIKIPHRFVGVPNHTFHAQSRKVTCDTRGQSASDSREVCNTSRRIVFGSSRLYLGSALDSPWLDYDLSVLFLDNVEMKKSSLQKKIALYLSKSEFIKFIESIELLRIFLFWKSSWKKKQCQSEVSNWQTKKFGSNKFIF